MTLEAKTRIADAILDMEHEVSCLRSMTKILGDMLDTELVEVGNDNPNPQFVVIKLTPDQLDNLSFAWNDVIARANRVHQLYLSALEGERIVL